MALTFPRPVRIGTRGSPLALAQAREIRARLAAAHPELAADGAVEIATFVTTGDRIQDRALVELGGKGLFTKEIEEALLSGDVHLAVHSMKDMPALMPPGLAVGATPPREDPRDAFFARGDLGLDDLPPGAVVGTSSLRRQAQILMRRPDLKVVPFRGNVDTRLRKLAEGQVDATLLAVAGLNRLGQGDRVTHKLDAAVMLPAVAQGTICVQVRDDEAGHALAAPLNCAETATRIAAERALLAALEGSCRTPIAGHAELRADGALRLRALVARPDGSEALSEERIGAPADAAAMGRDAAAALKARMPADFLAP